MEWFKKYKGILVNATIAMAIGFVTIFLFTIMFSVIKKELFETESIVVKVRCDDVVYLVNKENITKNEFLYSEYTSNNKFEVFSMEGCTVHDEN